MILTRVFSLSRAGLLMIVGSLLLNTGAAKAQTFNDDAARGQEFNSRPTLVGSWESVWDVPNLGGTNLTFLLSFTSDHILIETDTPAAIPVQGQNVYLGNAHGAWKSTRNGGFEFTYVKKFYSAALGSSLAVGQTKINAAGTVSPDGKHLQITSATLVVSDGNGNVVITASAGTATATRILVDDAN
jgi:hypothetical protein